MYRYNRLTDNDTNWGPLTIGERSTTWRPLGMDLRSGDDEHPGCALNLHALGWTVRVKLPAVLKPWREWHAVKGDSYWEKRGGGYWNIWPREFGFSFSSGTLHLHYGPQTHDSVTTKSKCIFLSWRQWRFVRRSLYDRTGAHFWTEPTGRQVPGRGAWEEQERMRDAVPKVVFAVEDYDGERVAATTHIEEMEWRFGEGWFKWLSLFRAPRIKRSLDIRFDKEVGPEKGSWKGGLVGTSVELQPGELHASAFRRWCAKGDTGRGGRHPLRLVGEA